MEGVVKQVGGGQVIECSCIEACKKANIGKKNLRPRGCQLSVDHGDRCSAYPCDTTTWLITEDTTQVRQLRTY